jgi:hypothetical protein
VLRVVHVVALVATGLALAGEANAYTCPQTTLAQRLEQADGAFVGRSTGFRSVEHDAGIPQRVYRFQVDQRVKGEIGRIVEVRLPVRTENGGQRIPEDVAAGVLAGRAGAEWVTTRCGITDPGALLSVADEPRGNAIKLVIGVLVLAGVLGYSVSRLRKRSVLQ